GRLIARGKQGWRCCDPRLARHRFRKRSRSSAARDRCQAAAARRRSAAWALPDQRSRPERFCSSLLDGSHKAKRRKSTDKLRSAASAQVSRKLREAWRKFARFADANALVATGFAAEQFDLAARDAEQFCQICAQVCIRLAVHGWCGDAQPQPPILPEQLVLGCAWLNAQPQQEVAVLVLERLHSSPRSTGNRSPSRRRMA